MSFIWLLMIVVFILVESFTYQLLCVWFALGSVGGLIASLITDNYVLQVVVFVSVSVLALLLLHPTVKKIIKPKGLKTNIEDLPGKEVIITDDVCNLKSVGQGKINGMEWSVRSADNSEIKKGSTAVVVGIEGVKLIVKEKEC